MDSCFSCTLATDIILFDCSSKGFSSSFLGNCLLYFFPNSIFFLNLFIIFIIILFENKATCGYIYPSLSIYINRVAN